MMICVLPDYFCYNWVHFNFFNLTNIRIFFIELLPKTIMKEHYYYCTRIAAVGIINTATETKINVNTVSSV